MDSIEAGTTPDNDETRGLVEGLLAKVQPLSQGLDVSFNPTSQAKPPPRPENTLSDFGTSLLAGAQESVLQPFADLPAHAGAWIASKLSGTEIDPAETRLGKFAASVRAARPETENPTSAVSTLGNMLGQLPEYAAAGAVAGPAGLATLGTAAGVGSGLEEVDAYHSVVDGLAPTAGQKTAFVVGKGLLGSLMGLGPLGSPGRAMVSTIQKELGQAGLIQLTFGVGDHVLRQQTIDPNAPLDVDSLVNQVGAALLVAGVGHGVGKVMEGKQPEVSPVKGEPSKPPTIGEPAVINTESDGHTVIPETGKLEPAPEAVLPTGKLEPTPITPEQRVGTIDPAPEQFQGVASKEVAPKEGSIVPEEKPIVPAATEPTVIETPSEPVKIPAEEPVPPSDARSEMHGDGWTSTPGEGYAPRPEPEPTPEQTIGIKRRAAEAQALAYGEFMPKHGESIVSKDVFENAARKITEDPTAGKRLVEELSNEPRPPSPDESALLSVEVVRLTKERAAAGEAYKADPSESNRQRILNARADYQKALDTVTTVGTKSGQAFGLRRFMLKEDMSVAEMERQQVQRNKGAPVSDEQAAVIQKLHEDFTRTLAAKDAEYARMTGERLSKMEADLASIETPNLKPRGKLLDFFDKQGDEALARLKTRLKSANASVFLDPEVHADLVKVAAKYIAHGVDAGVKLVEHFGEEIRPHIDAIMEAAKGMHDPASASRLRRVADLERQIKVLEKKIEDNDVAAKREKQGPQVEEIDKLIKERDELQDTIVGMREKQFRPKELQLKRRIEEVEQKLRENNLKPKGQRQGPDTPEIAALKAKRDALNKEMTAERTRPDVAPEVKRLQKQVAELDSRIAAGDIGPREQAQRKTVDTEEVAALKAKRQDLQDVIAKTRRGDPELKRLEKQLADIEARIGSRNLKPKPTQVRKTVDSVEVAEARASLAEAQKELERLRFEAKPMVDLEQRRVKSATKAKERSTLRLQEKSMYHDFSTRKRPSMPKDPAYEKAAAAHEAVNAEYEKLKHDDYIKNRTPLEAAKDRAIAIPQALLQVRAGFDASFFAGMQGGAFLASHPIEAIKLIPEALRGALSDKGFAEIKARIDARPTAEWDRLTNLDLTEMDTPTTHAEEGFRSSFINKIPGVRMSNRGFVTYLNLMSATWKNILDKSSGEPLSVERSKLNANAVNIWRGRGAVGKGTFADAIRVLGHINWAPRLMVSRFEAAVGGPIWYAGYKHDPVAVRTLAIEYARMAAGLATAQVMLNLAGEEQEYDPRATHFLETRFGKTWVDPTFGIANAVTFMVRMLGGETKDSKGHLTPIRGKVPYGKPDAVDVVKNFERGKLGPAASIVVDTVVGHDMVGGPVWTPKWFAEHTLPLAPLDIYDALKEEGFSKGAALGILSFMGIQVNTYEKARR